MTIDIEKLRELLGAATPEILDELERYRRGWPRACPCLHTTPCHERCTCINSFSSSGCRRCCTYGSKDQQRIKAERLVAEEEIVELAYASHDDPQRPGHHPPWHLVMARAIETARKIR